MCRSQRPIITFCWFPPDSEEIAAFMEGVFTRSCLITPDAALSAALRLTNRRIGSVTYEELAANSAFSVTDRSGTIDWRIRSRGTSAKPELIAALGEDNRAFRPRISTWPVTPVIPKSASITSGAPSPGKLVTPRISPSLTSKETPLSVVPRKSRTCSTGAPSISWEPCGCSASDFSGPTSWSTRASWSRSFTGQDPTRRPSRMTVMRSQILKTSANRWVTKTRPIPSFASLRICSNIRSTSAGRSALVGSSKMIRRALEASALAIATRADSCGDSSLTSVRGSSESPTRSSNARVRACATRMLTNPTDRGRPWVSRTFSVIEIVGTRLPCW